MRQGKDVTVDIYPQYTGKEIRPDSLIVKYTLDGEPQTVVELFNRSAKR